MSTTTYRPNSETKQQLEELDALIQRMLGLPLGLETESPAPASTLPPVPQFTQPISPTSNLTIKPLPTPPSTVQAWRVEMPAPLPAQAEVVPAEVPWATAIDPTPTPLPLPRFRLPPVVAMPASVPTFPPPPRQSPLVFGSQMPLPPMAEPVQGYPSTTAAPVSRPAGLAAPGPKTAIDFPVPWTWWPIIGFNRLVEVLLYCFGPLGAAFTKPLGRNLIGWLGVLMILGAIAWGIADWLGVDWTR